ncbi:MAG: D-alanyl-D-alanine carboxypeptidase [Candidatus Omnitrophica bacterium]|nr:D-alanyl-D-alanine carboxypeptidase [Candidatus Omnitrophota bacterium]
MKKLKIFILFLIMSFVVNMAVPEVAFAKKSKRRSSSAVSAKAAIFSNSTAVKRYYGKNVHMRVPPASTTKVMTALLVLENLPMDKVLTVSSRATQVQPTTINLRVGEKFTVRDLLLAILLKSANDASIVLAEAVAGSEEKFVAMMNKRAREIGARNTKFVNSNGLPSRKTQYSSPYDMYLIFRKAVENDFFRRTLKLRYHKITSSGGRQVMLKSHNKILLNDWKQKIYGKTGYTRAAKSCFVGYLMKGNDICIIAVFGCTRRWEDIKHIVERYGGIDL